MHLILSVLLISINTFAIEWQDLEVLQDYQLKQTFQLPQTERSGSFYSFSEGDKVVLKEKFPLAGIGVMLYVLRYLPCPGQDMGTDMEIIPVQETAPMIEIGAQLEPGCELNFYVESKDLGTKSILK